MLTWSPSPAATPAFRALFDRCRDGAHLVDTADGLFFLASFGLAKPLVKRIWSLADASGVGSIGFDRFSVALRLVALAQAGYEVSEASFKATQHVDLSVPRLPGTGQSPAASSTAPDDFGAFESASASTLNATGPMHAKTAPSSHDATFGEFSAASTSTVTAPVLPKRTGGAFEELLTWPGSGGTLLGSVSASPLESSGAAVPSSDLLRHQPIVAQPLLPHRAVMTAPTGSSAVLGTAGATRGVPSALDAALESLSGATSLPRAVESDEFGDFQAPPSPSSGASVIVTQPPTVQAFHARNIVQTASGDGDDDEFGGFQAPSQPVDPFNATLRSDVSHAERSGSHGVAVAVDIFASATPLVHINAVPDNRPSQDLDMFAPSAPPSSSAVPSVAAGSHKSQAAASVVAPAQPGGIALKRSFGAPSSTAGILSHQQTTAAPVSSLAALPPLAVHAPAAAAVPAVAPSQTALRSATQRGKLPVPTSSGTPTGSTTVSAANRAGSSDVAPAAGASGAHVMSLAAFVAESPVAQVARPSSKAEAPPAAAPSPPVAPTLDRWGAASLSSLASLRSQKPLPRGDDLAVITALSVVSAIVDEGTAHLHAVKADLEALQQPLSQRGAGRSKPAALASTAARPSSSAAASRAALVLRVAAAAAQSLTSLHVTPDTRSLVTGELQRARALADDADLSQALARSLDLESMVVLQQTALQLNDEAHGGSQASPHSLKLPLASAPGASRSAPASVPASSPATLSAPAIARAPGALALDPFSASTALPSSVAPSHVASAPLASAPLASAPLASAPLPKQAECTPALLEIPLPPPVPSNKIDEVFGDMLPCDERQEPTKSHQMQVTDDDEFSSFSAAPPSQPGTVSACDDDEFSSFSAAPSILASGHNVPLSISGTFSALHPARSTIVVAADDDEFSSFFVAPPVTAVEPRVPSTTAVPAVVSNVDESTEDDEFSAFDSAPPTAVSASLASFSAAPPILASGHNVPLSISGTVSASHFAQNAIVVAADDDEFSSFVVAPPVTALEPGVPSTADVPAVVSDVNESTEDDDFSAFDSAPPSTAAVSAPLAPAYMPAAPSAAFHAAEEARIASFNVAPISSSMFEKGLPPEAPQITAAVQVASTEGTPARLPPPAPEYDTDDSEGSSSNTALPMRSSNASGVTAVPASVPASVQNEDAFSGLESESETHASHFAVTQVATGLFASHLTTVSEEMIAPPPAPLHDDDDDEFTGFAAAAVTDRSTTPNATVAVDAVFTTVANAVDVSRATPPPLHAHDDENSDVSEFVSASTEVVQAPITAKTSSSLATHEVLPGANPDASPATQSAPASANDIELTRPEDNNDDDEFSEFNDAPLPARQPVVSPDVDKYGVSTYDASASNVAELHVSSLSSTTNEIAHVNTACSNNSDDDEFTAFDSAPFSSASASVEVEVLAPKLADHDADDEFGAFDDNPSTIAATMHMAPTVLERIDVTAVTAVPSSALGEAFDDDDEFTAFDAAPTANAGQTLFQDPTQAQRLESNSQTSALLLSLDDAFGEAGFSEVAPQTDLCLPVDPATVSLSIAPALANAAPPAAAAAAEDDAQPWLVPVHFPAPLRDAISVLGSDSSSPALFAACAGLRAAALQRCVASSHAAKAAAVADDRLEDALAEKARGVAAGRLLGAAQAEAGAPPVLEAPPASLLPHASLREALGRLGARGLLHLLADAADSLAPELPPAQASVPPAEEGVLREVWLELRPLLHCVPPSPPGAATRAVPRSLSDLAACSVPAALAFQRLAALTSLSGRPAALRAPPPPYRQWASMGRFVANAALRLHEAVAGTLKEQAGLDLVTPEDALRSCLCSDDAAAVAAAAAASAPLCRQVSALAVAAGVLAAVAEAAAASEPARGSPADAEAVAAALRDAAASLEQARTCVFNLLSAAGATAKAQGAASSASLSVPLAEALALLSPPLARLGAALSNRSSSSSSSSSSSAPAARAKGCPAPSEAPLSANEASLVRGLLEGEVVAACRWVAGGGAGGWPGVPAALPSHWLAPPGGPPAESTPQLPPSQALCTVCLGPLAEAAAGGVTGGSQLLPRHEACRLLSDHAAAATPAPAPLPLTA